MNTFILFISFVTLAANSHAKQHDDSYQPQLVDSVNNPAAATYFELDSGGKCEPLNTDVLQLCKDIAYNETRFPNFMKQTWLPIVVSKRYILTIPIVL